MVNKKFQQEYNRLNAKQKEAVDTIEGPVMVVAGPGTGKTQILAMRIANILVKTQVEAGNILALTFTNSGVWAMKKRLLEIIGPASYKVHVHTFHSFCNEVIQTFPEKFLFSKTLDQVTDLDQILIIQKILDAGNYQKIKAFKAPYHYQKAIIEQIRSLKQENIAPGEFERVVEKELKAIEQLPDLYHDKGPSKGKIKSKYADLIVQLEKNLELAQVYSLYEKKLKESGKYDFADMILFVADKFKKDKELLSYYQEKFQYILVDEYQDTNSAQNEVLRLLASFYDGDPSFYTEPNLFVVGDDEQSIYRFQGAALENILFFVKNYPQTKIIVLEENYRSGQKILDSARYVIQNNTHQIFNILNIAKNLKSQTDLVSSIGLAQFSTGQVEDFYILATIKKLLKKGTKPTEIACIYKEHRDGQNLAEILAKSGVPFSQNNSENILEDKDIRKILLILDIINNPYQSQKLFEVMNLGFLNLNQLDIYRVANLASIKRQGIFDILNDELEFKNKKAVDGFIKKVLAASRNFGNLTFAHAFELLINDWGYLKFLLNLPDAPIKLNRLKSLFDEIKILNVRDKDLNLKTFLLYIEQLNENNLSIKEEPLDINFQGVRLLTAHQAKGLEFEHVFILHLTDGKWGNKTKRQLIKLPSGLLKNETTPEEEDEEERRLFYVALTRAKKNIYLSFANNYSNAGTNVPSKFLSEIPKKLLSDINVKAYESSFTKRLKISLTPEVWHKSKDLKQFLKELAENFILNATAFNAYLKCPQCFFYDHFLRVPKVKDFNLAYGSAVHFALEMFFKKQIKDFKLPDKKFLIKSYRTGLKREILSSIDHKRALAQGTKTLNEYFDFHKLEWIKKIPAATEYTFGYHNVHFDNIPLNGKIDKIELTDSAAHKVKIIDYKTSKPKTLNFLMGKTAEADTSYLYQAYFYKLLAENDPLFGWAISDIEFEFLTPEKGKFLKVSIPVEKDEYENFKNLVKKVYAQITVLDFNPSEHANKKHCQDCEYFDICQTDLD